MFGIQAIVREKKRTVDVLVMNNVFYLFMFSYGVMVANLHKVADTVYIDFMLAQNSLVFGPIFV